MLSIHWVKVADEGGCQGCSTREPKHVLLIAFARIVSKTDVLTVLRLCEDCAGALRKQLAVLPEHGV